MRFYFSLISLTLVSGLYVSSCSQENPYIVTEIKTNKETNISYDIPADSALAYLETFLNDTGNTMSRSKRERVVASIHPVAFSQSLSRTLPEIAACKNLLYVANFENKQGYAILAADKRISQTVIAITDEGTLSDATIYSAMERVNSERVIIDEYPLTGDGFFTTPETGDEVFINPNTVVLYVESEHDTLVGNFSLDDIGAQDENGNPITDETSSPEQFMGYICMSYAINEIIENNNHSSTRPTTDEIIGGDGSSSTTTETTASDWSIKKNVDPMLVRFKGWHQDSPFNDLYPERRSVILFGHKKKARAGCFPLAIAKILAFFEHPDSFTYNGYTVNWQDLKYNILSSSGKTSAAYLLKGISSGCDSWYFYHGTFTFPGKATSYMRFLGLNNAHSHSYSFDRVTNMLDEGKPLIIYSVPGINIFKSHCWNIDGYKIKERKITIKTYRGGSLIKTDERKETSNMVHCDFGWEGKCNGYYVSGVFKLNDSRAELDPDADSKEKTNYNHLINVVTY